MCLSSISGYRLMQELLPNTERDVQPLRPSHNPKQVAGYDSQPCQCFLGDMSAAGLRPGTAAFEGSTASTTRGLAADSRDHSPSREKLPATTGGALVTRLLRGLAATTTRAKRTASTTAPARDPAGDTRAQSGTPASAAHACHHARTSHAPTPPTTLAATTPATNMSNLFTPKTAWDIKTLTFF
ncbi:unnamed protein product [Chrysodeixis includens]|uniref:Uncharacterized protein n=1 Tax=Chrysodeixis includens TaxID=689277 RepID=A0A9N8PZ89_CHRIL|nr:unnamed protein product [Chrysodeixis includens]